MILVGEVTAGKNTGSGDGAPRITDEHPRMEFFRNQGANMVDTEIAGLLEPAQAGWGFVDGLASEPATWRRVETENAALRGYLRSRTRGERAAGVEAARTSRGTEFFLYGHGCTERQLQTLAGLAASDGEASARLTAQRRRCAQLLQN